MKTETKMVIAVACLTFLFCCMIDVIYIIVDKNRFENKEVIDSVENKQKEAFSVNQSSVYNMICIADIKHPDIVLRQAVLETGHFKSNVLKKNNNLFGFHNGKEYLKFKTIFDSCIYYKEWQKHHYFGGDYYVFLNEYKYASDSNYVNVLKQIKINV